MFEGHVQQISCSIILVPQAEIVLALDFEMLPAAQPIDSRQIALMVDGRLVTAIVRWDRGANTISLETSDDQTTIQVALINACGLAGMAFSEGRSFAERISRALHSGARFV